MPKYDVEVDVTGYYTLVVEASDELEAEDIARRTVTLDRPEIVVSIDAYDVED
jgi:hypothetical protein